MHKVRFKPARLVPVLLLLVVFIAACAPGESAVPTRRPTRPPATSNKVARIATNTPNATRTPRPTRTRVPTEAPTPTRENTPVEKEQDTPAPTEPAAVAAAAQERVPATSVPTEVPTQVPTEAPTSTPAREGAAWEYIWDMDVNAPCEVTGGGDFGVLGAGGWEGRPPEQHPDLNLAVRGYKVVNYDRELVDYDGHTDGNAPQLWGLFADRRTPEISHTFGVFDWDWNLNTHGDVISDFDVTMVGFRMHEGETVFTPDFGHEIGEGYAALVLYADVHRVTLKYTGEDNVIDGYTLHLEGLCVYSNLLNLYNDRHAAGRGALPALRPGQPIGYMPTTELGVAIRDRGAFMDPRSRKDWWQGR